MDFRLGGYVMSHAVNSPKPWARDYLKFSLQGKPPGLRTRDFGKTANTDTTFSRSGRTETEPCAEGGYRHWQSMAPPLNPSLSSVWLTVEGEFMEGKPRMEQSQMNTEKSGPPRVHSASSVAEVKDDLGTSGILMRKNFCER